MWHWIPGDISGWILKFMPRYINIRFEAMRYTSQYFVLWDTGINFKTLYLLMDVPLGSGFKTSWVDGEQF